MGYDSAKAKLDKDNDDVKMAQGAPDSASAPDTSDIKKIAKGCVIEVFNKYREETLDETLASLTSDVNDLKTKLPNSQKDFSLLEGELKELRGKIDDLEEKLHDFTKEVEPSDYDLLHPNEEHQRLFVREPWVAYKSDPKKVFYGNTKEDAEIAADGSEPSVSHVAHRERWFSRSKTEFSFTRRLTEEENIRWNELKAKRG